LGVTLTVTLWAELVRVSSSAARLAVIAPAVINMKTSHAAGETSLFAVAI
jgi:hypothetical protein